MKILLCTDSSRSGLGAIRLGGGIAAQLEADITLLCVVKQQQRDLEDSLERAVEALGDRVGTLEFIGRRGDLLEEMRAQLQQTTYDLVIVGYCARSFLEKAIWGSLAVRIAHEVPASVLIVRGWRDRIKRVLIGISGGGFTDECARWGGRIAAACGARATLVHASPAPPLMYGGFGEVVETLVEFLQTDTLEAQALRQAVVHLTEMGVRADVEFAHGLPEREIPRLAQDRDVDLLVIGSAWATQPVRRLFARNITEQILKNTRRPVLVVRPARL